MSLVILRSKDPTTAATASFGVTFTRLHTTFWSSSLWRVS